MNDITFIERVSASWWRIGLLFIVQGLLLGGLFAIGERYTSVTAGFEPFDFQNDLTVSQLRGQLEAVTAESRQLYALFAAVDFVFPAVGALFFVTLSVKLLQVINSRWADAVLQRRLWLLLAFTAVWDWLENIAFLVLIFGTGRSVPAWAAWAIRFKQLKLGFLSGAQWLLGALAISALLAWGVRRWQRRAGRKVN